MNTKFISIAIIQICRCNINNTGLLLLAKLLAWFIFFLFLSNMERKEKKMNRAKTLVKKNKSYKWIQYTYYRLRRVINNCERNCYSFKMTEKKDYES